MTASSPSSLNLAYAYRSDSPHRHPLHHNNHRQSLLEDLSDFREYRFYHDSLHRGRPKSLLRSLAPSRLRQLMSLTVLEIRVKKSLPGCHTQASSWFSKIPYSFSHCSQISYRCRGSSRFRFVLESPFACSPVPCPTSNLSQASLNAAGLSIHISLITVRKRSCVAESMAWNRIDWPITRLPALPLCAEAVEAFIIDERSMITMFRDLTKALFEDNGT
jgi:hypothetical protein